VFSRPWMSSGASHNSETLDERLSGSMSPMEVAANYAPTVQPPLQVGTDSPASLQSTCNYVAYGSRPLVVY